MGRTLPLLIIGLVAMALAWLVFLRPVSLGGPAGYVVVSGSSMEPTLHAGDLAVTRKQGSYEAGAVVAFRVREDEPGAGGRVIHRIVGGSAEERFVMQGDNKEGPDLWRPGGDDILGKMWFSVPRAGRLLAVLQSPVLLAGLASGVAVFLVLIGPEGAKTKGASEESQRQGRPSRRRFPSWRRLRRAILSLLPTVVLPAAIAVLLGSGTGSAAGLTVNGGAIQVFTFSVNLRPAPPSDLSCHILGWFRAELRWSPAASPAEGYRIYHKGLWPRGGGFRLLAQIPDASATSYQGLRPSLLPHSYFMTSYLSSWDSGPSETINVHCKPRVHFPGPCGLEGENHHSQRTVELTWDPAAGAVYYAVLRGTASGGPYELLATTDVPAYSDTAVRDGATYYYVILALDAAGNESEPSVEVAVEDIAPTPTPTPTWAPTATPTLEPTSTTEPPATPAPDTPSTVEPAATAPSTPTPTPTWTPAPTVAPESVPVTEPAETPIPTPTSVI